MVLEIPSVEDCGCCVQQPLTPAGAEQNGDGTAWFGPALSHTPGTQPFPATMLFATLQTTLFAQMHLLFIN